MKRELLLVCGIFLVLVSTGIVSGTTNVVNVQSTDTTPPVVTVPADITVQTTSPVGAVVIFTVTATDNVGVLSINCTPASGSIFPVGSTTVTCTATDTAGNIATKTFTVTVTPPPDTTPPVMALVNNPSPVQATDPQGAVVTYIVIATDDRDGQLTPICTPASGSIFPVGNTQVTCRATDRAGNTAAPLTFIITVIPPPTPIPPPASSCTGSGSGNSVITGTPGPDTIIGTSGNNVISGLEGDDLINGCGGRDRISGNADDDGIAGGPQGDDLNGNEGDDIMQGDDGNDRLAGGSGINSLTGGPGRDDFICSPGSETTITDFEPGIDRISGPCILAASAEEMSTTSIPLEVFPMPLPN